MLDRLKCLFGFHVWLRYYKANNEYTQYEYKIKCVNCGKTIEGIE